MRDVPQQRVNANGSRRLARRYLEILWLQEIDEVDSMNALHAIRGQLAALITALSTAVLAEWDRGVFRRQFGLVAGFVFSAGLLGITVIEVANEVRGRRPWTFP